MLEHVNINRRGLLRNVIRRWKHGYNYVSPAVALKTRLSDVIECFYMLRIIINLILIISLIMTYGFVSVIITDSILC